MAVSNTLTAAGDLSRDDAFLAAALNGECSEWPVNLQSDSSRLRIWRRIQFHGIAFALAGKVETLAAWPDALREKVREEAQLQAFWEESHRAMLLRIFNALGERAIDCLVMKGTALAYSVYDAPAMRRRGDSDLLVKQADLDATREALAALGMTRREDPHGLFFQETWLSDTGFGMIHAVDLHWQPTDRPALQHVLRLEEYFDRTIPLPRLAPNARMPRPVLTFLQGAINQAWHRVHGYFVESERVIGGERLVWAMDNALLAGAFGEDDWEGLTQLAIARDVAPLVLASLQLAERHFSANAPPEVMARLQAAPAETRLTRYLLSDGPADEFFADFAASRGLSRKLAFLKANATASRQHLLGKYPRAQSWPTALLQARRMLELVGRAAKAKLR